uniref:ULP_PROTEASE domain-containing protein n=1 Tax=Caenorhabditis tropicalis TaxID=1561998 RepID=A0A1I7T2U0_9PELO
MWYVSKFTPGPIGTSYIMEGPRRKREYIELSTNCKDDPPAHTHLHILVIQSLVTAGVEKKFPTPMPTILSLISFKGIRNSKKINKRLDGEEMVGSYIVLGIDKEDRSGSQDTPHNDDYFLNTFNKRSKSCTNIFSNLLSQNKQTKVDIRLMNYDTRRVIYLIHVLDNEKLGEEGLLKSLTYPEHNKRAHTGESIRRVDSKLADLIRRNQMDVVFFSPISQGWSEENPYEKMFISEYSVATAQSIHHERSDRLPYVVWYKKDSENPLVLCGSHEPGRTSRFFEQVPATYKDANSLVCTNEKNLLPNTVLTATYIVVNHPTIEKSQEGNLDENGVGNMPSEVQEETVCAEGRKTQLYSVDLELCELDEEEIERRASIRKNYCYSSYNTAPPAIENPYDVSARDLMLMMKTGSYMSNTFIEDVMKLILFEDNVKKATYQSMCAVNPAIFHEVLDDSQNNCWPSGENLFFFLTPHLFGDSNLLEHFSAVCCTRSKSECLIYDSLPSYRKVYTPETCAKITKAVSLWAPGVKWVTKLAEDAAVSTQVDGSSCALFAIHHMSQFIGFTTLQAGEEVAENPLRKAMIRYLKEKVERGLVRILQDSKDVFSFDNGEKEILKPKLKLSFMNVPTSARRLSALDVPLDDDIYDDAHVSCDATGVPCARVLERSMKKIKKNSIRDFLTGPQEHEAETCITEGDKEGLSDLEVINHVKSDVEKNFQFGNKLHEMYDLLQQLLSLAQAQQQNNKRQIDVRLKEVVTEGNRMGLLGQLREMDDKFKLGGDRKTLLQYSEWLALHLDNTPETSFFYCKVCSVSDTSHASQSIRSESVEIDEECEKTIGKVNLEDVIIPQKK